MNLILLGAPGAGKGTQSKIILEKYKIPQVSTGEMLIGAVAKETELGKKIVISIVKERLKKRDCKNGFILDGFPRTIAQAEALDKIMEEMRKKIDAAININVP